MNSFISSKDMDSTRRNPSAEVHDICPGNGFLDMTIKSQMTTTKKDKGLIFYQTENLT